MRISLPKLRQDGDTLVEVIIAVAVVSIVLVGAYNVTQRSSAAVRNGQEESEVMQILQSQVEHVRDAALKQSSSNGGVFTETSYCMAKPAGGADNAELVLTPASSDLCKKVNNNYEVNVTYDPTTKVFGFTGSWTGASGQAKSKKLSYRIYSGDLVSVAPTSLPPGGGESVIGSAGGCGTPGQPSCSAVNPDGSYRYTFRSTNASNNDPSIVLGCSWNWGDGNVDTYTGADPHCLYGARSEVHTYAPWPGEPAWPALCGFHEYRIRLIMNIKDVGSITSQTQYAKLPYCGY